VGVRRRDFVLGAVPVLAATNSSATSFSFLIFFELDRWDISEAAVRTCRQVATAYLSPSRIYGLDADVGDRRIAMIGRAEAFETNAGELSLRRANATMSELVRLGVRATDIGIKAVGDADPFPAGVQGVSNRSVMLYLR
jgi:outer membrane protein OmpA-like peptidoglycan-associated protein